MKIGKWYGNLCYGLYQRERRFICSECNEQSDYIYNFCPHCGAIMETEEGFILNNGEELKALIDEKVRVLHELLSKREQLDIDIDNEINELHELRYKMVEAMKCGD